MSMNFENKMLIVVGAYMEVLTVSLFGHRRIEHLKRLDEHFLLLIKGLLTKNAYVEFLIGRNGEFDEYGASMIKIARKELGTENCDMTLILPYKVSKIEYYEKYYDHIIIPENLFGVHPKNAITQKNRWMIEHSDLVIFYVEHEKGGAYAAMQYAKKLNKSIINLADFVP